MVNSSNKAAAEETRVELTPMIDVTFLLLIFFLCSIQFKVLEGRLQTFLPKDVGPSDNPVKDLLEFVDIRIERLNSRENLGLDDPAALAAWLQRGSHENELRITANGVWTPDLSALATLLADLRAATPPPDDPAGPDQVIGTEDDEMDALRLRLRAEKGVLYTDVVGVVDTAVTAGITSVTFRGVEMDS